MTRSIVFVWTEGDRHFDTLTLFQSREILCTGKMAAPFVGRRHFKMAAPTFSMAAAIPEIRDLVRYKMAASRSYQNNHLIGILVHHERSYKMMFYQFVLIN